MSSPSSLKGSAPSECAEPCSKKPKVDLSLRSPNTSTNADGKTDLQSYNTEKHVGINCYITSGFTPIPGVVKQRFSDFLVNEISEIGDIVHFTTTEVPELPTTQVTTDIGETSPLDDTIIAELESLIKSGDEKMVVKVPAPVIKPGDEKMVVKVPAPVIKSGDEKVVRVPAPVSKEERRSIHQYIKTRFPGLISNCIEFEGKKVLEISRHRKGNSDNRSTWPKDKCHLKFVLYKEYKDTQEALDIISKHSGVKAQQFQYSGTKDKRAKTSQLITAFKVPAEKLAKVNSRLYGMRLGNFEYCAKQLTLGQLTGNHFNVVLRDVHTTKDNLEKATDEIAAKGFINYFGMQRFGTSTVPTYEVGKCLLRSDMDAAIDTIMASRQNDDDNSKKARLLWKDKKAAKEVFGLLPYSSFIERRLMQGVMKHGVHNLSAAFQELPRPSRLLYLHSYQSLLWNKVASQRIQKYGLKPVVGDLVFTNKDALSNDDESADEFSSPVRCITDSDLSQFTITDVILPIPGCKVELPGNEVKEWFEKLLDEDSLSLKSFNHKQKEFRLPGAYRQLVVKPTNVKARLAYYNEITDELVSSDYDILQGKAPVELDDGKHQAAVLEFSLPSSCYATMLLREITRTDTSARHQSTLNHT